MDSKELNRELAELYGSAWFYSSYYLLMKSESREDDNGTNYFYKSGKEAADLYDMIGWDFVIKDAAYKSRLERERIRRINSGDKKGYDELLLSEERYEYEKELALKASHLGRFLGMDGFKQKIKDFILSEERTEWFEKHREETVHEEALVRVLALKFRTDKRDILPLSAIRKEPGKFVALSFGKETAVEPVRFLGVENVDDKEVYYVEHLREIGTAWSGTGSVFNNFKDSVSHDGCLEVVTIPAEDADKLYVALNTEGSFVRGRLETRCAISDITRRTRDNILHKKYSLYRGKPIVSIDDVVSRYMARNERYFPGLEKKEKEYIAEEEKKVIEEQEALANEIRTYGDSGTSRLEAMLNNEIKRQRNEVMARYRQFYKSRPEQGEAGRNKNPSVRSRDTNLIIDKDRDIRNRRPNEL